jgi:hypothetical protein
MNRSYCLLFLSGIALIASGLSAAETNLTYLSCQSPGNEPFTWMIDTSKKKVFGYVGRGDGLKELAILDWSDDRIVASWHETQNKYFLDRLTLRLKIEYFPSGITMWNCSPRKPVL